MTWQAMLRLPDKAGALVDEYAARWGVERAVAARVLLMEHLRQIEEGHAAAPEQLSQSQDTPR
jgi:hypothetical protein